MGGYDIASAPDGRGGRAPFAPAKQLAQWAAMLAALFLAACVADGRRGDEDAAPVAPLFTLPLTIDYDGRPVVQARVNGAGPFDFVVDTAASQTAVFGNLLESLSLAAPTSRTLRVFSLSGVQEQPFMTLERFEIGGLSFDDFGVVVFDDWVNQNRTPQGVLGLDVTSAYFLVFDPARGELAFYDPARPPDLMRRGWSAAKLREERFGFSSRPLYVMEARFGRRRVPMLLDTGAEVSLGNLPLVAYLMDSRRFISRSQATRIADAADKLTGAFRLVFEALTINGVSFGGGALFATDAPIFEDLGYGDRPFAILGFDMLGRSAFAVDFARGALYAAPAPQQPPEAEITANRP